MNWRQINHRHHRAPVGLFNERLMNDAVYKFKRYEDASLQYLGIYKHEGEGVGLFGAVLTSEEFLGTPKTTLSSSVAPPVQTHQ